MERKPPVACTLRPGELQDRTRAWSHLIDGWLVGREPLPQGVRLVFARTPGVEAATEELLRLEAECCAWMHGRLHDDGHRLVVDLTGDGPEAAEAVVRMFGAVKP